MNKVSYSIISMLLVCCAGFTQNYDGFESFDALTTNEFLDDNGSTVASVESVSLGGVNGVNSEGEYGYVVTKAASDPWQAAALVLQDNYMDLTNVRTIEVDIYSNESTFILAKAVDGVNGGTEGATDAQHPGGGWATLIFNFDIPKDGGVAAFDEFSKLFFFPLWNGDGWDGSGGNSAVTATAYDNVKYSAGAEINSDPDSDPSFDNLVWYDEFDGNGAIDGSKWHHQTQLIAGDSWANNEKQHYTNRTTNSYVNNGTLKIVAREESYTDQGVTKQFTSARLNSKYAFQNGRVEVRAKLPSFAGTWPAIWLLGQNINEDGSYWDNLGFGTTYWPFCGEIDIMEPNIPKTEILATWHWDNGSGYTMNSDFIEVSNIETSQNFHLYALEWTSNTMKIYFDDILVNEMNTFAPFNQDFFILLNLAMGGNLGGNIDPNFSQDRMEIDYVRVYQQSTLSDTEFSFDHQRINISPNPVEEVLTIVTSFKNETVKLIISDVTGREVMNQVVHMRDGMIQVDATSFFSGLYFGRLYFGDTKNKVIKFIKK